jgi:hypothetical protein
VKEVNISFFGRHQQLRTKNKLMVAGEVNDATSDEDSEKEQL